MKRIGILGGGQLAQMLILAGTPLGFEFLIYAPEESESTKSFAKTHVGPYAPCEALEDFLKSIDLITFENENIPLDFAHFIEHKKPFFPSAHALGCCQDRLQEKALFDTLNIPTHPYKSVHTQKDLEKAAQVLSYPFILKTTRQGYDGKGQYRLFNSADLDQIDWNFSQHAYIAESWVPFEYELSLIAVRHKNGDIRYYDLCQNTHREGILTETKNIRESPLKQEACEYMRRILAYFNYVGVLVIEFFVLKGKLLANEMAPRVHNSGHWTLEGAVCSQFENHLRAITNLPLGSPDSLGNVLMKNIIGSWPDRKKLLSDPRLHLYDYLKTPKPKRKLGHLTWVYDVDQQTPDI